MAYTTYEIHNALSEDLNEGLVWIRNEALFCDINNKRPVVAICFLDYKPKSVEECVYCEALYADRSYLNRWMDRARKNKKQYWSDRISGCLEKKPLIFMSGWYRRRLGIESSISESEADRVIRSATAGYEVRVDVEVAGPLSTVWQYPHQHPQAMVLSSGMLGIIGLGLGIFGVGLGLKDPLTVLFHVELGAAVLIGGVISLVGIVVSGVGGYGLVKRR